MTYYSDVRIFLCTTPTNMNRSFEGRKRDRSNIRAI